MLSFYNLEFKDESHIWVSTSVLLYYCCNSQTCLSCGKVVACALVVIFVRDSFVLPLRLCKLLSHWTNIEFEDFAIQGLGCKVFMGVENKMQCEFVMNQYGCCSLDLKHPRHKSKLLSVHDLLARVEQMINWLFKIR